MSIITKAIIQLVDHSWNSFYHIYSKVSFIRSVGLLDDPNPDHFPRNREFPWNIHVWVPDGGFPIPLHHPPACRFPTQKSWFQCSVEVVRVRKSVNNNEKFRISCRPYQFWAQRDKTEYIRAESFQCNRNGRFSYQKPTLCHRHCTRKFDFWWKVFVASRSKTSFQKSPYQRPGWVLCLWIVFKFSKF